MERNNSDFEGSGIGEGRFDEYEEEKAKFSDAILPFIILTFMIIGLAGIIYLHITEIRKYPVRRQLRLNMTENSSLLHGKHRMEERILTMLRMHLIKAIQ